jgi:hypothetical protein
MKHTKPILISKAEFALLQRALKGLAAILMMLSFAASAAAMDISNWRLPNGFQAVLAKGTIVDGDAKRLRIALQSADRDEYGFKNLVLDSPGGLVGEALAMAALVDQEKLSTWVLPGAECASACAQIVFLSGQYRIVFDGGRLGIHSCSKSGIRDDLCNDEIAKNAFVHGIPYGSVMAFMQQRGASEMAWFSSRDADCWGFTLWPPEYHRGIKRGEPAPCVIKIYECLKKGLKANDCH